MQIPTLHVTRFIGVLLVVICSLGATAQAVPRLHECSFLNAPEIQELGDARFERIFRNVIAAYRRDVTSFALCTNTADTMPGLGKKFVNGKTIYVVMVPRFVLALSDLAATGLFGHEIGHILVGFQLYSMRYEIEVDLKAVEYVGYEPLLACHREMDKLLAEHAPINYTHNETGEQVRERVNELIGQMITP